MLRTEYRAPRSSWAGGINVVGNLGYYWNSTCYNNLGTSGPSPIERKGIKTSESTYRSVIATQISLLFRYF